MANQELITKTAEVCGSSLAITCGALRWFADNRDAVTTMVGIGGLTIALLGYVTNLYFVWRRDEREREYHRLRIARESLPHD